MVKRPDKPSASYEVGYGKPPTGTRFKPGHSGNLKGRPRKQTTLFEIVESLLREKVSVTLNGRCKTMRRQDVALRAVANHAMTGNLKSLAFLLNLKDRYRDLNDPILHPKLLSGDDLALLQDFLERQDDEPLPLTDDGGSDAEN